MFHFFPPISAPVVVKRVGHQVGGLAAGGRKVADHHELVLEQRCVGIGCVLQLAMLLRS